MAIYEGPYWFRQLPGQKSQRLGVDYDPKTRKVTKHLVPDTVERSRGRHDPGSGPYWNRRASGGSAHFEVEGTKDVLVLGCFDVYDPGTPSGYWKPGAECYLKWDGRHFSKLTVGVSNWSGTTGGRWMVEGSFVYHPSYGYSSRWDQLLCYYGKKYTTPRYLFGNEDDPQARADAYALRDHLWAVWTNAAAFEYPNSDQRTAGWGRKGKYVEKRPRLSSTIPGLTARIEEGDPTLSGLQVATANAYVDCVDKLPSLMSQNNIANILDVLNALRSFRDGFSAVHNLKELASSAWMGYRYAYGTTKADIEEAAELLDRLGGLLGATSFKSHGSAMTPDGWKVRCVLELTTDEFSGLMSKVEKWGLALNGYALWDMVPYSFIIDWFTDIGGYLEFAEKQKVAYRIPPQSCWYSIEHKWVNEYGFPEVYYHRFNWDVHRSLASYTSHGASCRTVVKRAIDVLAMFS